MDTKKKALVLFVDDDTDDQEFFVNATAKIRPQTEFQVAENGREALALLASLPEGRYPCVIILDLNMPVMDGYQTLQELNKLTGYKKIPKIILTTSDEPRETARCLQIGALDYFIKPSDIRQWTNTAERIMDYCR